MRDRYLQMSPHVLELEMGCANVHSKLMAIDDELLLVGSPNLNNRSIARGALGRRRIAAQARSAAAA